METVTFVQFVVIEQRENIMGQAVVTAVKDSSGEVFEKITLIHVGE